VRNDESKYSNDARRRAMQRILVICGAGASSTFLVHWIRKVARSRGLDLALQAGSRDGMSSRLMDIDVVLVGSHLADSFPDLRSEAEAANVQAVLMPAVGFDADGAGTVLDLIADSAAADSAVADSAAEPAAAPAVAPEPQPSGSNNPGRSHG
jgi:cellobiose PTS system EIIB component